MDDSEGTFSLKPSLLRNSEIQNFRNSECENVNVNFFFILPPLPGGSRLALGPRASLGLGGWEIKITPVIKPVEFD